MGDRLAAVVCTVRDGFQAMQKKKSPAEAGLFLEARAGVEPA
ncbi:hypothetical protein BCEN4_990028 [Burkholderia cenocepacia]|nr:hypothetical protein [Burkholderia cenocepacia]CAD9229342.1 hypothetical protein BCEN4_990028 [Burkholderia cenocepacia]